MNRGDIRNPGPGSAPSRPQIPGRLPVFLVLLAIIASLPGCGRRDTEQDIVSYVNELRKADFLHRMAAAQELSTAATETDVVAVPYLIETLREPRELIQRSAAQALGRIGCHSAIPALIEGLRNPASTDYVRYDCVQALGRMDNPRVHQPLIDALRDESSYVRWAASEALGELRVEQAFPRLVAGLRDRSSFVRSASANALGMIGDPAAIPNLKATLYDRNLWVRNASARALARLGDNEGIPILIRNLESEAQERGEMVRSEAAEFLREVTGREFGFDPLAPAEERREAIRRWDNWWQSRR